MNRGKQPGRRSCGGGRARRPEVERPHEEVGRKCGGEHEERVHAPEAPVDGEHPGSRRDDRRRDACEPAFEPPGEVVAEPDGRQREHDGQPSERRRRFIEDEGEVDEQEVEGRATPVPEDCRDDLADRPGADQTRNGLILEERLAVDIRRQVRQEEGRRADHTRYGGPPGA